MKIIGLLTSGDDSPGLNAAIRIASSFGLKAKAISHGYKDFIDVDFEIIELAKTLR